MAAAALPTAPRTADGSSTTTTIDDDALGLHVDVHHSWLPAPDARRWWSECVEHVRWFRVRYKSARFKNDCETPCWTSFFGGDPQFVPFEPVPGWLQPLVAQVSSQCGGVPFNAMLVRLYFDGADEIAYHTDGRTFLGDTPTIASLSLGATAQFQMRRMTNVWPCGGDDGVDHSTARRDFGVSDGDLLVMRGDTQKHWHHRVPKARSRRPRININFRYIIPGSPDAERGQQTYYKYMIHGDSAMPPSSSPQAQGGLRDKTLAAPDRWRNDHTGPVAPSHSYADLLRRRGSLLSFVQSGSSGGSGAAAAETVGSASGGSSGDSSSLSAAASGERSEEAESQLRAILGPGPSDAELGALLRRCGWDVQRAVAAHFNDGVGAPPPSAGADGGGRGAEARPAQGTKRPTQAAEGQNKKGKQRSVLSMWGSK
jgi:alkylated DNA repair dioxygenase AlkB